MHGPVERLALGRHGGNLLRRWVPVVPFAVDGVVAAKDRHPVIFRVCPGGGAVGQRFGKEEQRTGGTAVGFPQRRVGVHQRVRRGKDAFMRAAD